MNVLDRRVEDLLSGAVSHADDRQLVLKRDELLYDQLRAAERSPRGIDRRLIGEVARDVLTDVVAAGVVAIDADDVSAVESDLDDECFARVVERLKEHIVAGDVFQIVPSRGFRLPCSDPLAAYARLRASNPSPYMFYVRGEGFTLFGTSPETCVKVHGVPPRERRRVRQEDDSSAAEGRDDGERPAPGAEHGQGLARALPRAVPGGGDGGGEPTSTSKTYLPRATGDVRFASDVIINIPALPISPYRLGSVN